MIFQKNPRFCNGILSKETSFLLKICKMVKEGLVEGDGTLLDLIYVHIRCNQRAVLSKKDYHFDFVRLIVHLTEFYYWSSGGKLALEYDSGLENVFAEKKRHSYFIVSRVGDWRD